MKFENFNIEKRILETLTEEGYIESTAVQEESLKITLEGKDVIVQSQTGTGKTAAFVIPIVNSFLKTKTRALIIAPTRELVVQIDKELQKIGKNTEIKTAAVFGGEGYEKQKAKINNKAEILVATPGRLMDFAKSGTINLKDFDILVLDEADRMLDMGFLQDINWIMKKMKPREQRQTMLFSATLNTKTRQLAWNLLNNPKEIEISPESVVIDKIEQSLYHVASEEKFQLLLGLLDREKPESAIIFVNTKYETEKISKRLNLNGFKSQFIMGDLPQNKRTKIIDKVKNKEIDILVATDVAARGLHINNLDLVINYDIPEDFENYVHRIGRTARAGEKGKAITLACPKFVYGLEAIEKYIGHKIPSDYAREELLLEDKSKGAVIQLDRSSNNKKPQQKSNSNRQRQGNSRQQPPKKSYPKKSASEKPSYQPKSQTEKPSYPKKQQTERPNQPYKKKSTAQQPSNKNSSRQNNQSRKPVSKMSDKERLAYYASKYGEDFKKTTKSQPAKQTQKKKQPAPQTKQPQQTASFFGKIKKLFKK
ncbi:MAG: DEAD/DEAH box helicase [Spirochaetales bacterium]|nr:DEAD/DEAH box helicase [Spirochaetales bacterium]